MAHLISDYSVHETEQILYTWNQFNSPEMREKEVQKCIASAAKGLAKDFNYYCNAMRLKIRQITGIEIKYRPITPPKPRTERKRSHIHERKQDVILHLQNRGGRMLVSQSRLAKKLSAPLRSIKLALSQLEKEGVIFRDAVSRGRKSFTVLILKTSNKTHNWKKQMVHTGTHYGDDENFLYLADLDNYIDLDRGQVPTSTLYEELGECLLL